MDIIYLLVPIALILVALAIWAFMWAVKSGQYEDMEGPAHRILMDDDAPKKNEISDVSGNNKDEN